MRTRSCGGGAVGKIPRSCRRDRPRPGAAGAGLARGRSRTHPVGSDL
jgi:hypothetical protein